MLKQKAALLQKHDSELIGKKKLGIILLMLSIQIEK